GTAPPENPLLRKYNMANRTRDTAGLRADIAAADNINIGLGVDWSEDKYSDSTIGFCQWQGPQPERRCHPDAHGADQSAPFREPPGNQVKTGRQPDVFVSGLVGRQ